MNIIKKELYEQVDSIEKQIEANQDKMIDYQERIAALDEMNSRLMDTIQKIMKKVREMPDDK